MTPHPSTTAPQSQSQSQSSSFSELFIGIDVAKAKLDVASEPPHPELSVFAHMAYTEAAVDDLTAVLSQLKSTVTLAVIVIEATGRLEAQVAYALQSAGLPVAVVNPRQARDFARAENTLAKTDSIDAGVLARFGRAIRPTPRPLPDALASALRDLVSRRRQILAMRDAEKHRLSAGRLAPKVRNDIVDHISQLDAHLKSIDNDIDGLIAAHPQWSQRDEQLQSVPGIGNVISHVLIAELPELGRLNRKQIAKLVGVAPFDRQSGRYSAPKAIWGGRARLRASLYMSALVAKEHNPIIKALYERLLAAGKAKKCALVACMHKLLTIANALLRKGTKWSAPQIKCPVTT